MADRPVKRITVTKNGPYRVDGGVPLARQIIEPNERGESWDWREGERFEVDDTYKLCRCGGSANKPICDGTHERNGFDGTETATFTIVDTFADSAYSYTYKVNLKTGVITRVN